jgi:hypothetical protein
MTFSASGLRRLPAFWPSVGSEMRRVQDEQAFIVFPDGFVGCITRKYGQNERAKRIQTELSEFALPARPLG